jgi:hypothetical protein
MTQLIFHAEWAGERAAGINPGYEKITITFEHGQPLDEDTVNYWRESVAQFYDGARVLTDSEEQAK